MVKHRRIATVLVVVALAGGVGVYRLIDSGGTPSVKPSAPPTTGGSPVSTTTNGLSTTTTTGGAAPSASDLADAQAMLANEANHGWTTCYESGAGLAINWDELDGKTVYDWNGAGQPDPCPAPYETRHQDRMTTLRFLHALLLFKADTGSAQFDSEISSIESVVLTLFTPSNPDPRGWAYEEMTGIASLTGNSKFTDIANAMLARYARSPYNDTRPDYEFEEASALVQSGIPSYVSQGTAELNRYWNADYLSNLQLISEPTEIESAENGDIAIALANAGMTSR